MMKFATSLLLFGLTLVSCRVEPTSIIGTWRTNSGAVLDLQDGGNIHGVLNQRYFLRSSSDSQEVRFSGKWSLLNEGIQECKVVLDLDSVAGKAMIFHSDNLLCEVGVNQAVTEIYFYPNEEGGNRISFQKAH